LSFCLSETLVKTDGDRAEAKSAPCRSWLCPNCTDKRRIELIAECHGGRPNTFLTLTSRRAAGKTAALAASELAHAWRLVRLRWMRLKKIKRLPFLAVMEATKAGWPHLHILLRSEFMSSKLLSEWMAELTDSPILKIERLDNRRKISAYICKYAGKCAHKFATCKRYWSSRDYQLPDVRNESATRDFPSGWRFVKDGLAAVVLTFAREGYAIAWADQHHFVAVRNRNKTGPPDGGAGREEFARITP
jgi:hypothetical protein